MEALADDSWNPDTALHRAILLYQDGLGVMHSLLTDIKRFRHERRPIPARKVWELGQAIFELRQGLASLSLQMDGLYAHLERDLDVKRKWLEKVVILRRYVTSQETIPDGLAWGDCEKGTKRVALSLGARERGRHDTLHEG
jgi:hypothetical protein